MAAPTKPCDRSAGAGSSPVRLPTMRLAVAFAALAAFTASAEADTIIAGGNLGSQTWTAANSPYTIQGDVTVIAGATLTIEAGTVVQAASSSDSQLAGRNTSRVEITVNGAL